MPGQLSFGEKDVLARAFGYDSQGRYIEDVFQGFKFNLQEPVIPVSTAANPYTGGSNSETQYGLEGTTSTTQTSFWNLTMTSQAISGGIWSYTGSTSANYTIHQEFQSTPTAEDINGGPDHVSKNVTWSMDTWGSSLTSISGSGSDLAYTLTTQETATDNSSGTLHFDQSDGVVYDGGMSGLDTYSITRFGNTTVSPSAGVTTTAYTETGNMIALWEFSGEGSYSHQIDEEDSAAGTSKHVSQDDWWTDESETSWSDVYTEIATVVIGSDGGESKTGNRLENVNVSQSSGTAWGGSFSYSETFVGQVPLIDPSSEQTPGESPDGTPPVPPPDPVDVPDSADDAVTTISYSEQWTGSQSQNVYDSYGDVITFGPSGVTTTSRLGFGGGGYAINLESSSVLSWNQTTGDVESANWSIASYSENSQADLTVSGGYLSMSNLTIVDGGSDPLTAGVTGTYSEDGSDQTNIVISTQGVSTYAAASVFIPDGPTVEPTVSSTITSVDNLDDTIHILSGDTYNDLVTFSGSDSLTLEHSQTDTYSFALTSLGDGTLSLQTQMAYPQNGNSLATFNESYTQSLSLDSGSTTDTSLTAQKVGQVTTVTLGPITETGTDASSFAFEATGTSTFHSSETGIYTAATPSADPTSGDPMDPNQPVSSPFTGLPTLTTINSNETWTDSLSFSNQSEYEQTINFNSDDSWSLSRTETGSGDSSFDQTLNSTLTINDEVGSIDDGLGTAFTFTEANNLHAWSDDEFTYNETVSLVSAAPTDPAETTPPEGETLPPEDPDVTISITHNETGESTSGLTLETTGSQSYQSIGGTDPLDQIEFSADWESSFVQNASGDYELSLAWNSNGFSSYSESGSLLTEYLVTGSSVSEFDQGFDSSVDGMQASSTEHFTASGSELINYAVATELSVTVPTDGSGNSLDPVTTVSLSESISVSGNAHAESDVLDLIHWAGDVETTSIAADGSQIIETEGVIYDSAIFTQSMFDETYFSTEQFSLEYASDTGIAVSGNQTSQSEVSGSLDITTDISSVTTGADQLSTLGVLTNSFHRTFTGADTNSSAYALTKASESDDVVAEFLSSSSSTWEATDTNVGTYEESAPTSDNTRVLAPVSDWNEYQQLSKSGLTSIEFDGETWTLAASGSGSLTSNGIYHSTLPDFVAPENTDEAFSYLLNETRGSSVDSQGVSTETHTYQFNLTSSPTNPGDGSYEPSSKMQALAAGFDAQFAPSAENQPNPDGTATPPELSPESQGKLRFIMDAFNGFVSYFDNSQFVNEKAGKDANEADDDLDLTDTSPENLVRVYRLIYGDDKLLKAFENSNGLIKVQDVDNGSFWKMYSYWLKGTITPPFWGDADLKEFDILYIDDGIASALEGALVLRQGLLEALGRNRGIEGFYINSVPPDEAKAALESRLQRLAAATTAAEVLKEIVVGSASILDVVDYAEAIGILLDKDQSLSTKGLTVVFAAAPFVPTTLARLGRKMDGVVPTTFGTRKFIDRINGLFDRADGANKLAVALIRSGIERLADVTPHHLIPMSLVKKGEEFKLLFIKAVVAGWDMNGSENGMFLGRKAHPLGGPNGGHLIYNKYIENRVAAYIRKHGIDNINPEMARDYLVDLASRTKKYIEDHPNTLLDDLFQYVD